MKRKPTKRNRTIKKRVGLNRLSDDAIRWNVMSQRWYPLGQVQAVHDILHSLWGVEMDDKVRDIIGEVMEQLLWVDDAFRKRLGRPK